MKKITLGYSPCPNDTFLFHALANQRIKTPLFDFDVQHHDITSLNQLAFQSKLDLTKVSFFTFGHIRKQYALLPVGSALGKGYGPLILTSPHAQGDPQSWKIGLPGPHTTAYLLTQLLLPTVKETVFLPFNQIISQMEKGELDAGVIINESRFTYEAHGLTLYKDLGEWWFQTTQLPLPLGCICISRQFSGEQREQLSQMVRSSLEYAYQHPNESLQYIQDHAQESDEAVIKQHIELYVNEYSSDLGKEGKRAIQYLLDQAEKHGLIPPAQDSLF